MTKVKICGLSEPATLEAAIDGGADFVGLVFYPRSPRHVTVPAAADLANRARGRALVVALVVDAEDRALAEIAEHVRPDYVQAHGTETPARVTRIAALTGIPVIKAVSVATAEDVNGATAYRDAARFVLFDAKVPPTQPNALPGGSGVNFDWRLVKDVAHNFMLAGGLTPENVAEAIAITGAAMVDVSSGVEKAPGVKDETRIRKFIEAAKAGR